MKERQIAKETIDLQSEVGESGFIEEMRTSVSIILRVTEDLLVHSRSPILFNAK